QGDRSIVEKAMAPAGFTTTDYAVRSVWPAEVPSWLSAGNAGVAFYRPGISRLGTSPVKVSEYLACSLPVVVNRGIGDSDEMIAGEGIGAVVGDFNHAEYSQAAKTLMELAGHAADIRKGTREVAEKLFDVRRVGV